jgi:flagellar biosynthesis component FlhA
MKVLILTKEDRQLIFRIATIPLAFAEEYGWEVNETEVTDDTELNNYSEIN